MIIINDNEYNINNIKVTYGNYSVVQDGKKREGISPIIYFKYDKFDVRVETVYNQKCLNEMQYNTIVDITKYISDISYEDEKGSKSLIYSNYSCKLNKLENKLFNIELICNYEEKEEKLQIYISENINI